MAASPSHRVSTGERLNTAETTGKIQQAVSARGIRMTRQRRVILQVMDDAEQHLDVDQILERAQKIDSGVHLVTVYRTIDLLKKQGLIDELDLLHLRGDRHYYETHGPRDHIHVACLRCGKVREFESRLYEQLKEQIARDFHMKVTVSRTEVGGYCAECLQKRSARPRLLFLAAVILAVALWPLLQQVMDIVSPDLDSNLKTGSSSWDLL